MIVRACLFIAFILSVDARAQLCRISSLFFNVDDARLSDGSKMRLDSLLEIIDEDEFLVELYGMTDSSGTDVYNVKLAERRMSAAERYLTANTKGKLLFKKKNLIEANVKVSSSQEVNLAYNRRVDVYLIPVKNGMLLLEGTNGGSAQVPQDYFEPCGVCNSDPEVKLYFDNAEAAAAGIIFQTTEGEPLITAGSIMLLSNPCTGKKNDTTAILYRICPEKADPKMTLWDADTINGKIYWRPSQETLSINPLTGCYEFLCTSPLGCNVDAKPGDYIIPDTLIRILWPETFSYRIMNVYDSQARSRYFSNEKSVTLSYKDSLFVAHLFGMSGKEYYYLTTVVDSMPATITYDRQSVTTTYAPPAEAFQKIPFSDTLLHLRHEKAMPGKFGFYLPEYNAFIPIDSVAGKYYVGHAPAMNYQFAYLRGKKLYVNRQENIKGKYSEKRNTLRIKFRKKNRKEFKLAKSFVPPAKK